MPPRNGHLLENEHILPHIPPLHPLTSLLPSPSHQSYLVPRDAHLAAILPFGGAPGALFSAFRASPLGLSVIGLTSSSRTRAETPRCFLRISRPPPDLPPSHLNIASQSEKFAYRLTHARLSCMQRARGLRPRSRRTAELFELAEVRRRELFQEACLLAALD